MMPAFITASGPTRHKLFAAVDEHFGSVTPFVKPGEQLCPEIEIFTYNNRASACYLERRCAAIHLNLSVTAKVYKPWNWFGKVGPLIHMLKRSTAQYVFCLDGDDTFPVRFPKLEECAELGDGIRFVRGNDWPDVPWIPKNSEHMYPAACAYFGKRDTILQLLERTARLWRCKNPVVIYRKGFDDQIAWKFHHFCYPELLSIDRDGKTLVNLGFDARIISRLKGLAGQRAG